MWQAVGIATGATVFTWLKDITDSTGCVAIYADTRDIGARDWDEGREYLLR